MFGVYIKVLALKFLYYNKKIYNRYRILIKNNLKKLLGLITIDFIQNILITWYKHLRDYLSKVNLSKKISIKHTAPQCNKHFLIHIHI
jgi:hypothetical protein